MMGPLTGRQRQCLDALATRQQTEAELHALVGGIRPARTTASLIRRGWARRTSAGAWEITDRGRERRQTGDQPPCIETSCGTTLGTKRYDGRCAKCADQHDVAQRSKASRGASR